MTKKNFLIFTLIGIIIFLISLFATKIGICRYINTSCSQIFDPIAETFLIFIPLFFLSLITYKMRDIVFQAWLKFAYIWVPLTIVLTLFAPEYDPSLLPITKGVVSFFMSAIFLVVSLIIVFFKHRSIKINR